MYRFSMSKMPIQSATMHVNTANALRLRNGIRKADEMISVAHPNTDGPFFSTR